MDFSNLKELMDNFVSEGHAPGTTIKVYIDNKEAFGYSSGYSDTENEREMQGDEYFFLYSCSKITTVTAGVQLLERGLISLDDPLYDYIPEYRDMYIKTESGETVKAKKDIKIRNLFNMTAGLTYDIKSDGINRARELTDGEMDTATVARCIAIDLLSFEPGEKFGYSLCHDVLGGLVSVVTGKKFRDYVRENIFEPLEMNKSVYHMTEEAMKKMAAQYRFVPNESDGTLDIVEAQRSGRAERGKYVNVGLTNTHILGEEYDSGGAGIISTVPDYIKLASALANHGLGHNGERILLPASVDLMRTNTLREKQLESFSWKQHTGTSLETRI